MTRRKVVVTDHVFPNLEPERAILDGLADLVVAPSTDPQALLEVCRDADALLNCYARLPPTLVQQLERCAIIARYGIGVDTIPLPTTRDKGIRVTNVPDYCIEEVADHTLALMLALARGLVRGIDQTRAGVWNVAAVAPLHRLRGRTLVLLGFGRIARALGLDILVCDPFVPQDPIAGLGARRVERDEAWEAADILSLHVPLEAETHHVVNAESLARLKPGALLVNTSRGGLVDLPAVCAALASGRLGGAALDVLETEPPTAETWIGTVPNLIVTPHLAFYSEESLVDLQRRTAEEVAPALRGEPALNPVH
ncbi:MULTISPECIES: C-terminal binding protein [Methylobacterium]|jgi:D-3-phosphoglycerate dehydrogenase|uniref:D-3-phosphoglycerate dehydrogenase n=4 Tax=Methylobacterium TaxID=407 RepID=A0AAJ1TKL6_9HYPH|nr:MULTISPECIES: C-terminal binding protein [Methylobacterium]GAN46979.1 D-isomer specific 2-hydroxyacid dehydrogenase, NAD-binding protein [Methylobacterium sp. ME121]MBN6823913.1 C-terminal binding protein [Methylobacterium organophilum]MCB4802337.1 C-terminal binding protein [Methylobacterium brachiatum]MDE4914473.1 C-terminal binding protein [Methylobacterium sp. 092160098-2]MDH2313446.1 C-terminal binding protein [Methylobacterium brachiatum]